MVELVFVFVLGVVSSFLSNIGGGAGYFILLPALQLLGVPPTAAIGTIKFGGVGIMVGSMVSARNKNIIRKDYLKPLLILTVIASIVGPQFTFLFSDNAVKVISSIIVVVTALASIASWRIAEGSRKVTPKQKYGGYLLFFIISVVFSGFGSGLGILVNYVLIGFLGLSAIETISTRRFLGLLSLPLQLIFFLGHGAVNIPLGSTLFVGTAVGGFLGLNLAVKRGNVFVKRIMAAVALILVITLFI